jgi:hypothetical protein
MQAPAGSRTARPALTLWIRVCIVLASSDGATFSREEDRMAAKKGAKKGATKGGRKTTKRKSSKKK